MIFKFKKGRTPFDRATTRVAPTIIILIFCMLSFCFASEKYPQRIISLNPSVTEILYSLKLDDKIIAVSNNCNYPAQAKQKFKIGDMSLNYEKIISLKPDLIIAEGSIFKETLNKLKNMNMPVLLINCGNIEEFKKSFLLVGKTTGKYGLACKLIKEFEDKLNKIKCRGVLQYAPTKNKPKVFVEVWNQPLMTASSGTFFDEIITISGGVNIAHKGDHKGRPYPIINIEFIIENNPDIIILTTSNIQDIYKNAPWKNINAVKNKKIYKINPDIISRPTLRLADAAQQISNWIRGLASQKS